MSSVSCEQICVFFQTMFDFFYYIVSSWTLRFFVRTCFEEWFRISLLFFLSLLCFYFFIKIITTSSKGRETARSPKPAVSLPLNPSLFGHGLGLCPKNPHASKWAALAANKSVCFFKRCLIFFITLCHPELVSGSHFYFFKRGFKSFLSLLCFYFFIKIVTTSSKGKGNSSESEARSLNLI